MQTIRIVTEIRTTIQEVRDLPTLPTIAMQVMRITSNKESGINDLVEVIEVDVALTGKILRTANSAYYGVPRKIDSLKMALMIVGMEEIGNLVATASVLKVFPVRPGSSPFDLSRYWFHCAAVADLTLGLYENLGVAKPGGVYVAGLLHDIGRLVLHQYFNHHHIAIFERMKRDNLRPAQAEMAEIGVDHGHIGAWLIQRWNLPEEIITAVAQHHIRPEDSPIHGLSAVIDHADTLFYEMENRKPEELIEYLRDSEKWQAWLGARSVTIPTMVQDLYRRLDRANRLLEMLK